MNCHELSSASLTICFTETFYLGQNDNKIVPTKKSDMKAMPICNGKIYLIEN